MAIKIKEEDQEYKRPINKKFGTILKLESPLPLREIQKTSVHLNFTRLEPGNVITVEPGIYFIETLLKEALLDPVRSEFIDFAKVKEYRVGVTRKSGESGSRTVCWSPRKDTRC